MSFCPFCRLSSRDCWASRCGEDEVSVRAAADADADRGDDLRKAALEDGVRS